MLSRGRRLQRRCDTLRALWEEPVLLRKREDQSPLTSQVWAYSRKCCRGMLHDSKLDLWARWKHGLLINYYITDLSTVTFRFEKQCLNKSLIPSICELCEQLSEMHMLMIISFTWLIQSCSPGWIMDTKCTKLLRLWVTLGWWEFALLQHTLGHKK